MSRISYYAPMTELDYAMRNEPTRLGWFETETAESWYLDRYNDVDGGMLWLTPSGRWIITGGDSATLITEDEARQELAAIGDHASIEEHIDRPKSGPGRPEIGPEVKVRLPQAVVDRIDAAAAAAGISRAEQLRRIILDGTP